MTAPRVLLAAKRLDPEASSEGICTARLLQLLVDRDVEVRVVTTDEAASAASLRDALPWYQGPLEHRTTLSPPPRHPIARRVRSVVDGAGVLIDGHPTWYRRSVHAWRSILDDRLRSGGVDVLVTRGAGGGFEPHLATVALDPGVAWIAHYHDPWPASRWPEPYRAPRTAALRRQERGHEAVLARADALTFPSARLRDWVVGDDPVLRAKSHVLAHLAEGAPPVGPPDDALVRTVAERPFSLVHTGTLLRHRRVDALLSALARFVAADPRRARATRLVLAGPDLTDPPPAEVVGPLEAAGVLHRHRDRVGRSTAAALVRDATATVLVEAAGPESPFFPAKLTDYLAAGGPVLALTPRESVASDLMGEAHPLRVAPDDDEAILAALERLWAAHDAGDLAALGVDGAARDALSADQVGAALDGCLGSVLAATGRPV
ncbi:MAG: glycosyltransferase [Acidimicrobiales bacterium]|nr:glycosyltransferase [Acidimicrobiales bacterium]